MNKTSAKLVTRQQRAHVRVAVERDARSRQQDQSEEALGCQDEEPKRQGLSYDIEKSGG